MTTRTQKQYELAVSCEISLQVAEEMIKNTVAEQLGRAVERLETQYDDAGKITGYRAYFSDGKILSTAGQLNNRVPKKIDRTFKPMVYE
jgi:hypothetical protein